MRAQAYILFYTREHPPTPTLLPLPLPQEEPELNMRDGKSGVFEEQVDEEVTLNFRNSQIPRFVELKRRLSLDHGGRMVLKRRRTAFW